MERIFYDMWSANFYIFRNIQNKNSIFLKIKCGTQRYTKLIVLITVSRLTMFINHRTITLIRGASKPGREAPLAPQDE